MGGYYSHASSDRMQLGAQPLIAGHLVEFPDGIKFARDHTFDICGEGVMVPFLRAGRILRKRGRRRFVGERPAPVAGALERCAEAQNRRLDQEIRDKCHGNCQKYIQRESAIWTG
jgi:hypothetical protein